MTTANIKKKTHTQTKGQSTVDEPAQLIALINEDIVEYVFGMVLEDPFDEEGTREFVFGILRETLSTQRGVDGAVVCDSLFALVDDIIIQ